MYSFPVSALCFLVIAGHMTVTWSGTEEHGGGARFYEQYNRSGLSYSKGTQPALVYRFVEQTMSRGCTVSIKCIATGNPTPSIKWLMDGFKPPYSERFMIGQYVTLNGDVISHFNVSSCSSLDSAEISCTATNDLGKASHKARLNIFGPPHVREFGRVETAVNGKDFSVKCPVGGFPIDHINWFREQTQLPLTSRQSTSLDGTLTIKNIQKSDKGNYTCTAKYKNISHSNTLQVNVVVPPKLTPFPPITVVEEGERVVKYCEAGGDAPIALEWRYNGVTLDPYDTTSHPHILIQHIGVDVALVLVITKVTLHYSQANFTCVATNNAGTDRLTTHLIVQVSPVVTKFQFPETLEGMRVSVHCTVSNYAQDLSFQWLKDGEAIANGQQGTWVLQMDPFSSILSIENVSLMNAGNYSCLTSNPHGTSSHIAQLTVFVPPKWITEPVDIEGVEGEMVVSHCEVDAQPPATIVWKKALDGRPGVYIDIPRHQGTTQVSPLSPTPLFLSNGTLLIPSASSSWEGKLIKFVCEAENGIGSAISKLIHVRINAPVKLQLGSKNVSLRSGNTGTLRCVVTGDFPIHLTWFHGQDEVLPILNPRYQIKTVNTTNGVSSEITLGNVHRTDALRPFTCTAKNLCSSVCRIDQQQMWLIVLDPPEPPMNLTAPNKGSRFVELMWKQRQVGSEQTSTRMLIKYKMERGTWTTIEVVGERKEVDDYSVLYSVVKELKPASTYQFFVTALNSVGSSESNEVVVSTSEEAPSVAPQNLTVIAISSTKLHVSWEALTWSNGDILGYNIGFRNAGETLQYKFSLLESTALELVLHRLDPFTRYELVIGAYNVKGQGPQSLPIQATTLEGFPLPPKGVSCYTLTSQKLRVTWNLLNEQESRGVVKGYGIYVQTAQAPMFMRDELTIVNATATQTSTVVENLSKFTLYDIHVVSYTTQGESDLSHPVYCQTAEDVPGPPEQLKLIKKDPLSAALVVWSPPSLLESNGDILHYTVYISNQPGRSVPSNITQLEVQLPRSKTVQVNVSASTKVGEGSSATILFHSDVGNSGALISLGKTLIVPYKNSITLDCLTMVGTPQRTWFFQSKILQENDQMYTESKGSLLKMTKLQAENSGNYSCFLPGFTWEGIQFKQERIFYALIVQTPPTLIRLYAHESTFETVSFRWTIKDSGKRTAVDGYMLHIKVIDEWIERKLSRKLNAYTLRDLKCGTPYSVFMTAYNKAGISKPSQLLNVTTNGSRPILAVPPTSLLNAINNTWVVVNIGQTFKDGGCYITSYRIFYRKNVDYAHWLTVDDNSYNGRKTVNLTNLEENTNYLIKIRAENEAGQTDVMVSARTFGISAEPSNNLMESSSSSLSFSLTTVGPAIISLALLLILLPIVFIICRKRLLTGRESSTDAFTYLKQNTHNSQLHQNQMYMTVKKSMPSKNSSEERDRISSTPDRTGLYATFELKDCGATQRRRHNYHEMGCSSYSGPKELHDTHFDNSLSSQRPMFVEDNDGDDEDYESIASDCDSIQPSRRCIGCEHSTNRKCANNYETSPRAINQPKYFRESNIYLEHVKHIRGKPLRTPGSKDSSGVEPKSYDDLMIADKASLSFCDEDMCQIKV